MYVIFNWELKQYFYGKTIEDGIPKLYFTKSEYEARRFKTNKDAKRAMRALRIKGSNWEILWV